MLYYDDVREGDRIPPLTVQVGPAQLFFFSAATNNGHRIHYDRTWAVDVEGYPDLVVHGPLQAALLARTVTDWAGGRGQLVRFSFQHRATAHPGDELRCTGTVTARHEPLVDLTVELRSTRLLVPGTATVRLPRRPGAVSPAAPGGSPSRTGRRAAPSP